MLTTLYIEKFDKKGNCLRIKGKGSSAEITLWLKEEKRLRKLGEIVLKNNEMKFVVFKRKSQHLYRMENAWGINYQLLHELIRLDVKTILVYEDEESKKYITTPEIWLSYDKKQYSNIGFELQCFMPIDKFEIIEDMKVAGNS